MLSRSDSRTGFAAILGGALIFAGQAGELAFGDDSDALMAVWVTLSSLGFAALLVAIWRLGHLVSSRIGRMGWRVSVAGAVFLALFAVQALVTVILTGDIPENFVLFGLGFVLLFVGHLLIATGLRGDLGRAWMLPLVGAAGILVAVTLDVHVTSDTPSLHDIGLFVFEGAWVALGVALLRRERQRRPDTASVVA